MLVKFDFSLALNTPMAFLCIWNKHQIPLHRLQSSSHAYCLSPSHSIPTPSRTSPPPALPHIAHSAWCTGLSCFFVLWMGWEKGPCPCCFLCLSEKLFPKTFLCLTLRSQVKCHLISGASLATHLKCYPPPTMTVMAPSPILLALEHKCISIWNLLFVDYLAHTNVSSNKKAIPFHYSVQNCAWHTVGP